jgi:hypothetical protein
MVLPLSASGTSGIIGMNYSAWTCCNALKSSSKLEDTASGVIFSVTVFCDMGVCFL